MWVTGHDVEFVAVRRLRQWTCGAERRRELIERRLGFVDVQQTGNTNVTGNGSGSGGGGGGWGGAGLVQGAGDVVLEPVEQGRHGRVAGEDSIGAKSDLVGEASDHRAERLQLVPCSGVAASLCRHQSLLGVEQSQRLCQRPDVVVREPQRLDLGQLGVVGERRQRAAEMIQRRV